jgi:phosphoribosylaminoimidazolecarboxamide formyltransferase/IMP cyclohydrolase
MAVPHPHVLALPFKKGVKCAEKQMQLTSFGEIPKGSKKEQWDSLFEEIPCLLQRFS